MTVLSHREPTAVSSIRMNSNTSDTSSLEITGEKTRRLIKTDKFAQKVEKLIKKKAGGPTHNQVRVQVLESLCLLLRCTFTELDRRSSSAIEEQLAANAFDEDHENISGTPSSNIKSRPNPREHSWSFHGRNEFDLIGNPTLRLNSITFQSIKDETEIKHSILMRAANSATDAGSFRLDIDPKAPNGLMEYANQIFPLLTTIWIECDPSAVTAVAQIRSLRVVIDAMHLSISRLCERAPRLQNEVDDLNEALKPYILEVSKHLLPHFPLDAPAGWSEDDVHEVAELNAAMATFFCNFLVFSGNGPLKDDAAARAAVPEFLSSVVNYLGRLFRLGKSKKRTSDDMDIDTTPTFSKADFTLFVTFLPTLKRLICDTIYVSAKQRQRVVAAFNKCFEECTPKSATKRACVFVIRDLLLSDSTTLNLLTHENIQSWLDSLPKILWQLQDSNPVASLAILKLLKFYTLRYGQSSPDSDTAEGILNLQKAMVPFFYTEVVSEKRGQTVKREFFGPFVALPVNVQRAAIELVYYFPGIIAPNMVSALIKCACHFKRTAETPAGTSADDDAMETEQSMSIEYSVSTATLQYLVDTLQVDRHFDQPSVFVGFNVSLVLSTCKPLKTPAETLSTVEDMTVRERIRAVSNIAASRCATAIGLGAELFDSVAETLKPVLEKATSNLIQMGAIALLDQLVFFSGCKIQALPQALDGELLLSNAIQRYLKAHFSVHSQSVDLKTAQQIFVSYPAVVLGPLLESLATGNEDSVVFSKQFLDQLIVTEQERFRACIPPNKLRLTQAIDRLAKLGVSSLVIDRLRSELEITLTSTQ